MNPTTLLLLAVSVSPQGPASKPDSPAAPVPTAVAAVRATVPPVLNRFDTDPAWASAPVISEFRVFRPTDGAQPKFRTEAKVIYDARDLYVLVRAYDPHPDSIVGLLARRDVQTPSDMITVFIDSYHDRRTGYEFDVNPVGVKTDYAIYQDGNEDGAWDGIWDVATKVDSLGWIAVFRFPLSQMRFAVGPSNTFGFTIARQVERTGEQDSWPPYHTNKPGLSSQLGELTGLSDLAPPRRFELAPYMVTKNVSVAQGGGFGRDQQASIGADFKVAVASNLTLTGTVNPDFGQVESDPAVLNLGAFETFFQERRPFFVEGNGLFQFNVNCSQVNCSGEELFYSRRIGATPQLGDGTGSTTILGAGKLTGRLPGGLNLGVIDAVTQHETGPGGITTEPGSNYGVIRMTQDLRNGNSGVGFMFTGVNRNLDSASSPYLAHSAYVGAVDTRHRFLNNRFEVSASVDWSQINGSPADITALQMNPVHYFQRPGGPLHVDSTATSLSGNAEEVHLGKVSGSVMGETSYLRRSPGFDPNDLGFMFQADQQTWNNWMGIFWRKPTKIYNQLQWNFNWWQWWSAAGLSTERAANTNVHVKFANLWWLHAGGTYGQLGTTWCDRCARGGPAVRQDPYLAPWWGFQGDDRHKLIPSFFSNMFFGDAGHNSSINLQPQLTYNASTSFNVSIGANITTQHADNQWFGQYDTLLATGQQHYTFAHLDQRTVGLTADLGYTITTNLSVQWHIAPFVSRGTYSNIRELANPASSSYDARYQPYADTSVANHPGGLDFKQFNSNLVVRWEYRPGSTIFVVWTQGRQDFQSLAGPDGLRGDFNNLFNLHPNNTFLVKASYWLNW
ncbi:MAG TPA: DUF5916 domain-containing protein [Gemmatimonadales bacterium]|nr:DUF5916 domain-containing protein [Gemmatimonadales bacterium]